ncbi:MAG: universal stress protein [Planctomycetia bacterium]|nr:universal stress protein [Planctomycetia bacterium]
MRVFFAVDGSREALNAVRQVGQFVSPATDAAAIYFAPPEVIFRRGGNVLAPVTDGVAAAVEPADVVLRQLSSDISLQDVAAEAVVEIVAKEARHLLPEPLAAGATMITARHTPREGILIESEKWGADLVVVGARGMTGLDTVLFGSVSRAVVHGSRIPVFVSRTVSEHRGDRPFRVLFASDGSACSEAALAAATKLTLPRNSEVIAVTAIETLPPEVPEWMAQAGRSAEAAEMIDRWTRETERDKYQAREGLATLLGKQLPPFAGAEVVVAEGHSAEQILKLVNERRIDLVVLGSQGKDLLKRLFIGSTSEKVLTHAPCSVLVAR